MRRFAFDSHPAPKWGIFKTSTVRITLLTPCLLRLETGSVTDQPTQIVWNREFETIPCKTMQNRNLFTIETQEVTFCIDIAQGKMASILLPDGTYVEDFATGNLLGTARTLDNVNGAVVLENGILSRSGVAVMADNSLCLTQDGHILPREGGSDLYFFAYGHDYLRALKDFYRLTGPVPLIPKYALGNWWSRYYAYTQEGYQALMQEFVNRKIPITVATIDMDWHWTDVMDRFGPDGEPGKPRTKEEWFYNRYLPGWTGYSWNTELFPDHRMLLTWLKAQGFHVTLNVHPSQGIRPYEDCYPRVCEKLGKEPESRERIPFDITDLSFVESYLDEAHHPHEADGVDFWWLDWQQGKVTSIPGLDPLWALNHYHTLDAARGQKRPLILSRYAGLGSHRYPLGFSGDSHMTWKSLDFQPYFTANAANAGYTWWSHDIGGHMHGVQDDELYLRWLQFGVFSPINRLHSSNSDFVGKEPWKRSWAVNEIAQRFLRLRHRMIPFLYSANYQTHRNGVPICMPLYYKYDQEEAYQANNTYIFGAQLLVAPITQPADRRLNLAYAHTWLPRGRWTDVFNGRIYRGGQWVRLYRDLDAIPVLAGEGSIVPMYETAETNDLSLSQPLEIHIWRGTGTFALYEDDGETQSDRHVITQLAVTEQGSGLQFTISPPEGDRALLPARRRITLRFRDVQCARVEASTEFAVFQKENTLCVSVFQESDGITVTLSDLVFTENPPKEALKNQLLTRVQGSNDWKSLTFPNRTPQWVQDALSELDAML